MALCVCREDNQASAQFNILFEDFVTDGMVDVIVEIIALFFSKLLRN